MDKAKPFSISKVIVWEAYKRVKANGGAAGVDCQSIAEFEVNLKDNLYKLWNRMASGSYLPPPVRRVEIPKSDGGKRPLGIPTVSDRIAQMVVKLVLEPEVEPDGLNSRLNPVLRGWINYYGKFYKSKLAPILGQFDYALVRWAKRKYKRLGGSPTRARAWLKRVAAQQPGLFAHWHITYAGMGER